MRRTFVFCAVPSFILLVACLSPAAHAQDGPTLFKTYCAACHESGDPHVPSRDVLAQLSPEQILQALEKGAMKAQAAERSRAQRRVLAEYLSGKPLNSESLNPIPKTAFCSTGTRAFSNSLNGPAWNGWGVTVTNPRFEPAETAGMTPQDVPRLKLRWAFGLPGASSGGTQPVVVGGRVYVADAEGDLFALDARSGCIDWTIAVEAGIRSAIVTGKFGTGGLAAYFGDQAANVYAVDLASGRALWKVKVDDYSRAAITGALQLYKGRLYVPVSSREESAGADPTYPCCRARGSVVALDAANGKQIWKTYTITHAAVPTTRNHIGTQLYGPSGGAVWNAPTIDAKRNVLYVGTGNNYSPPATEGSDSIVAFDLDNGKIRWTHQITEKDVWNGSCLRKDRDPAVCPDGDAPDFDFSTSPMLINLAGGRQLIVVGNKSGIEFALDPDDQGMTVWQQRIAKGSLSGGILWGAAADTANVYAADGDFDAANLDASGGMSALELKSGRIIWHVAAASCVDKSPCKPSQVAAVSAISGAVFSGTMDGRLFAYATSDGSVIWTYDTAREFPTVNDVPAHGGSMSNGGATIVDGMLFVNSGYSHHGGILPGNVLLAFSPE
jgi:polyvinyl alcohol dehydrogenase (cytochrome)